jgi:hypothetical protein
MRVRCISAVPTPLQAARLGRNYVAGRTEYPVDEGVEYTVLGVGFWDGVVWYEVAASLRTLVSVPAFLFEIESGKPSRHWDIRMHDDGALTLWPASFYHPYYHDHLSDGRPGAVEDFRGLLALLEKEAGQPG